MSDLKLFRMAGQSVTALAVSPVVLEKSIQDIFEKNLETLLGVRFIASEFMIDGGRMDSLGIDENGSPVIIEYKRSSNENVINQGLFYLDWLMSHRKDFEWQVMERFGRAEADKIDWSGPRLVCIAGSHALPTRAFALWRRGVRGASARVDDLRRREDKRQMSRGEKLLERMRANPRDWRIEDVAKLCDAFGVTCTPPRKGSHYKVKHGSQAEILTIPAHRPIKPVYVTDLVRFIERVIEAGE